MSLGDDMYVGEVLLVDAVERFRLYQDKLARPGRQKLINEVIDGTACLTDVDTSKNVSTLLTWVKGFRDAWGFLMLEGHPNFTAACEDNKLSVSYVRKMVRNEYVLEFSPKVVQTACEQYLSQREQFA